jgi:hypothetical protein
MFIVIPRIRVNRPAPRTAAPPTQGPFAFTPSPPDGETALFFDRRVGFSHALPNWPQPMQLTPMPGEPLWDTAMQFWELPAWVRYRLERPAVAARTAMELAMLQSANAASHRAGRPITARAARPEQLAAWRVEGAAFVAFDLPRPDAQGADVEEALVLVRAGHVMNVALRYAKARLDWVRLASFRAAIEASILWDPAHGQAPRRIWPESTWLEPMAAPVLKPPRQRAIAGLSPRFALPQAEREALSGVFQQMLMTPFPPWSGIGPAERAWHGDALARATTSGALRGLFQQGLGEVLSVHDLRGFALMSGTAMQASG